MACKIIKKCDLCGTLIDSGQTYSMVTVHSETGKYEGTAEDVIGSRQVELDICPMCLPIFFKRISMLTA